LISIEERLEKLVDRVKSNREMRVAAVESAKRQAEEFATQREKVIRERALKPLREITDAFTKAGIKGSTSLRDRTIRASVMEASFAVDLHMDGLDIVGIHIVANPPTESSAKLEVKGWGPEKIAEALQDRFLHHLEECQESNMF
jgi:hypothetical protein